jgi:hypothetical protein
VLDDLRRAEARTRAERAGRAAPAFRIERGDPARDKGAMLALLERNLASPETREAKYGRYYERNPSGPPAFWVARESGSDRVIGAVTLFPVPFRVEGMLVHAGIQGDFAVDPEYRGAFGPAIPLVRAMTAWLDESAIAFSYGIPNPNSGPIVSRLSGHAVGTVGGYAKPLRLDRALELANRVPKPLRRSARLLDPLLRLVSREDRNRLRRSRGYRLEIPPVFDGRFSDLWREAHRTHAIIGDRSARHLNWKYGLDPVAADIAYTILAVLDPTDRVAGYAVVTESEGKLVVADILCRSSRGETDRLLGHLVSWGRRRRVAGIGVRYFGPEGMLTSRLRSFGFVRWRDGAPLVVRPGASPSVVDESGTESWYFVGGDSDV